MDGWDGLHVLWQGNSSEKLTFYFIFIFYVLFLFCAGDARLGFNYKCSSSSCVEPISPVANGQVGAMREKRQVGRHIDRRKTGSHLEQTAQNKTMDIVIDADFHRRACRRKYCPPFPGGLNRSSPDQVELIEVGLLLVVVST